MTVMLPLDHCCARRPKTNHRMKVNECPLFFCLMVPFKNFFNFDALFCFSRNITTGGCCARAVAAAPAARWPSYRWRSSYWQCGLRCNLEWWLVATLLMSLQITLFCGGLGLNKYVSQLCWSCFASSKACEENTTPVSPPTVNKKIKPKAHSEILGSPSFF